MDLVLSEIRWEHCLVYIDDIVIMGKTFKNHLQNLRIVLEKLRAAGLLLKPAKCRENVSFLGHVITRQDISTDPDKIDTVKKCSDFSKRSATVLGTRWILLSLHSRFLHDHDAPLPAD